MATPTAITMHQYSPTAIHYTKNIFESMCKTSLLHSMMAWPGLKHSNDNNHNHHQQHNQVQHCQEVVQFMEMLGSFNVL